MRHVLSSTRVGNHKIIVYILFHINTLVNSFVFRITGYMVPTVCEMSVEPWDFHVDTVELFFSTVPLFGVVHVAEREFQIVCPSGNNCARQPGVPVVQVQRFYVRMQTVQYVAEYLVFEPSHCVAS